MSLDKLNGIKIILGSGSPRRQEFFRAMGLDFEIRLKPVEEVYPPELQGSEISDYLAKLKAEAHSDTLEMGELLITSDTVVWHRGVSLAKPENDQDAVQMLKRLSNDWHEVITSICITSKENQQLVNHITRVKFKELSEEEIWYYIRNGNPLDKAGGYGIQEWIGLIAIEEIQGSYTNVVGLPTQLLYKTLIDMAS